MAARIAKVAAHIRDKADVASLQEFPVGTLKEHFGSTNFWHIPLFGDVSGVTGSASHFFNEQSWLCGVTSCRPPRSSQFTRGSYSVTLWNLPPRQEITIW